MISRNRVPFLQDARVPYPRARFLVQPVPYERTTSYGKGTKNGPGAILRASGYLELLDEETGEETWQRGIITLPPFNCARPEKIFFSELEKRAAGLLSSFKGVPFFLGGEHSITQALLPPFQAKYRGLSILHFDAHADLRPEYQGTARSHACALYPASRTSRTVQVGIRSVAPEEKRYTNAGLVKTHIMSRRPDIAALTRAVLKGLSDTVYMTIDADGFDPSVMPGTGTPQPGGFTWHEALELFRAVCRVKRVVGVDLVEVRPLKGSPITEFNAAKLIYRLMGYISAADRIKAKG
jgi:agmatinase